MILLILLFIFLFALDCTSKEKYELLCIYIIAYTFLFAIEYKMDTSFFTPTFMILVVSFYVLILIAQDNIKGYKSKKLKIRKK